MVVSMILFYAFHTCFIKLCLRSTNIDFKALKFIPAHLSNEKENIYIIYPNFVFRDLFCTYTFYEISSCAFNSINE